MDVQAAIDDFLSGELFAVAGASRDRSKYGNKVLRCYLQAGRRAIPVNPHETEIEGEHCVPSVTALTETVHGLSIITPPEVSVGIVEEAARTGIRRVWMQPGAESDEAIEVASSAGMLVIAGGPCVLVALRFRE